MTAFVNKIETLPQPVLFCICLFFTTALGVADYLTGDLTLLVFYFIPIAFATWFIGRSAGLIISVICSLEFFVTDVLLKMSGSSFLSIKIWNAFMEATLLLLTSQLLYLLKNEFEKSRQKTRMLEAANTELEAFNYSVAHDLRTPLTWIGGYSNLLLKRYSETFDEQHREFLSKIAEGTLRMQQLIDALLNFAQVGQCELQRNPVNLSEIAQGIAVELTAVMPERRVKFLIAPNVVAVGDKSLLNVVLRNLLENAWKYSGQNPEAVIAFGVMKKGSSPAYFVSDNGIGFLSSDAEKVFNPFKRLDGTDEFRGNGIGLATVQRIIQRHGGGIWATGAVGSGATFYFRI